MPSGFTNAVSAIAGNLANNLLDPAAYLASRQAWNLSPIKKALEDNIEALWVRRWIDNLDYSRAMAYYGWNKTGVSNTSITPLVINGDKVDFRAVGGEGGIAIDKAISSLQIDNLSPEMIIHLLRMGKLNFPATDYLLTKAGFPTTAVQQLLIWAYRWIPSSQDLIRYAVREGFTPDLVKEYGYDLEFPEQIRKFTEWNGMEYDIGINKPRRRLPNGELAPEEGATWADLEWWSHWELPSLTSGYDMLHRLYGSSDYGPSPDVTEHTRFESANLETLQKAQDIPEYWRKRLQAISYHPLTRVDVRRMYKLGVLNESGIYHAYRAIGYNDANAKNLVAFTKAEVLPREQRVNLQSMLNFACRMYSNGIMNEQSYENNLLTLGLTDEQASAAKHKCNLERDLKYTHEATRYIRRGFMRGVLSEHDAREALLNLNLALDWVNREVELWKLQRRFGRREASVSVATKLFNANMISKDDLIARLQNLEYVDRDITLMVNLIMANKREAELRVRQRLEARKARYLAKKGRNNLRALRAREQRIRRHITNLLRQSTPRNMKKWYRKNLITLAEIVRRLTLKEWSAEDIRNYLVTELNIEKEIASNVANVQEAAGQNGDGNNG